MLESSDVSGLALELNDGTTAYVWLTDALGTMTIAEAKALTKVLGKAGVPLSARPREVVRLFPPMMLEADSGTDTWRIWIWGAVIFLGPSVLVFLAILARSLAS